MNFTKSVVIVFVSVISASMNTISGTDPTRNENLMREKARPTTTVASSSSTPKKSYKGVLLSDDSKKEFSQDRNDEPLDNSLREAIDKATEKFLTEKLQRIIDGPAAHPSLDPSTELEKTLPETTLKPPEEEHYQIDGDDDGTDSRLKAVMDDALDELRAADILEKSSSSHSPSTEDANSIVKSNEEEHYQSESDDASHFSSLDPRLEAAMKDAVKEQGGRYVLDTSSSSSEDSHPSDPTIVPSFSTDRQTNMSSFAENESASIPPPYQLDSFPKLQPSKAKKPAEETDETKKAPVENASLTPDGATKKMSYAIALLSTPKEDVQEDRTRSRTFPMLGATSSQKKDRHDKSPEEDAVEFFCPQEKEEVAIQTQATSLKLRYSANKRHVLVSPKLPHQSVFHEFRRMKIDPRRFGLHTSICLPSGSVLLKFKTEEGTQQLHKAALSSGLFEVSSTKTSSCQVRIHGVSVKTTKVELIYDIFRKYQAIPQKVRFTRDERATSKSLSLAIIEVSEPLLEKIMASPDIKVRWQPHKIETTVRLFRCAKCYLLGHRSKLCRMPPRSPPDDEEECVDCTYSNRCSELVGRPRDRAKDTNHSTNDYDLCEVKQNQVFKYAEKFGREVELEPLII